MKTEKLAIVISMMVLSLLTVAAHGDSPTTRPATEASTAGSAEQLMNQMLKPPPKAPKPLQPKLDAPAFDHVTGVGGVIKTPPKALRREGEFIIDQVGRLTHNADGTQAELSFEADGKTLKDPPMIILPNLKLMQMEEIAKNTNRDLRFRVSGMITEFRGRNYLLLEKVLVPPDTNTPF